jgi:hypothetical protein
MLRKKEILEVGIHQKKFREELRNLKSEFYNLRLKNGGLAQLARAPALHAGGQRFDSVILHEIIGNYQLIIINC